MFPKRSPKSCCMEKLFIWWWIHIYVPEFWSGTYTSMTCWFCGKALWRKCFVEYLGKHTFHIYKCFLCKDYYILRFNYYYWIYWVSPQRFIESLLFQIIFTCRKLSSTSISRGCTGGPIPVARRNFTTLTNYKVEATTLKQRFMNVFQ